MISRRIPYRPLAAILIALVVTAVFSGVLSNGFVNLDDPDYVTANPNVSSGITIAGLRWATGSFEAGNWHPMTWLSHMADVSLFGMNPAGHHATSLLIHAVNAALCFLVLAAYTSAPWRSAAVALLFALHPLRVESVAWVAERKDLLSGLFFFLVLYAWLRYARRPSVRRYTLMTLLFVLGLMAKPMLVTLPLILLLVDWWPLGRINLPGSPPPAAGIATVPLRRALLEKLPLLALSAASSVVTFIAQREWGAVKGIEEISVGFRILNATHSAIAYLLRSVVPVDLAVFYPLPMSDPPILRWVVALLFVVAISITVFELRVRRPVLLIGWLWYIVMFLPVSGILQVGAAAMADRYTYLPLLGPVIAAVWFIPPPQSMSPVARRLAAVWACIFVGLLSLATIRLIPVWRDSVSLFSHAIEVTEGNWFAENNLGGALLDEGQLEEAATHLRESLEMKPDQAQGHVNLGHYLLQVGDPISALAEYRAAYTLSPGNWMAHYGMGQTLLRFDKAEDAERRFEEAYRLAGVETPGGRMRFLLAFGPTGRAASQAENDIGAAFAELGLFDEAIGHYERATVLDPSFPAPWYNAGVARDRQRRPDLSEGLYRRVVAADPANRKARFNLAISLLNQAREGEARAEAGELVRIDPAMGAELLGIIDGEGP